MSPSALSMATTPGEGGVDHFALFLIDDLDHADTIGFIKYQGIDVWGLPCLNVGDDRAAEIAVIQGDGFLVAAGDVEDKNAHERFREVFITADDVDFTSLFTDRVGNGNRICEAQ